MLPLNRSLELFPWCQASPLLQVADAHLSGPAGLQWAFLSLLTFSCSSWSARGLSWCSLWLLTLHSSFAEMTLGSQRVLSPEVILETNTVSFFSKLFFSPPVFQASCPLFLVIAEIGYNENLSTCTLLILF